MRLLRRHLSSPPLTCRRVGCGLYLRYIVAVAILPFLYDDVENRKSTLHVIRASRC